MINIDLVRESKIAKQHFYEKMDLFIDYLKAFDYVNPISAFRQFSYPNWGRGGGGNLQGFSCESFALVRNSLRGARGYYFRR